MSVTGDRLAAVLRDIPGVPPEMIQCAEYGYYHDYESPLAQPDVQLVMDLRTLARAKSTAAGSRSLLLELAKRVIDGDFDATRQEAAEWGDSPDGRAALRQFGGAFG